MNGHAESETGNRAEIAVLAAVLLLAAARLWGMSLGCEITRDESGLLWAVSGGWNEIYARATRFPQSLLYASLVLEEQRFGAREEWLLRLPSLFGSLATFGGILWFVSKRFGAAAATYGILFALAAPVVTANGNAIRPYAIGIAFSVLSWFLMARFLESGSRWHLLVWAVVAAIPAYFSVFFCLVPLAQWLGAIVWLVRLPGFWRRVTGLVAAGVFALAGHVPLLGYVRALSRTASLHSYVSPPTAADLVTALLPPGLALGLAAVFLSGWFLGRARNGTSVGAVHSGRDADGHLLLTPVLLLGVVQAVLPILVLFGVSVVRRGAVVFHARYFAAAVVAQAVVLGALFARRSIPAIRLPVAAAVLVASLPGYWQLGRLWPRRDLDFREAAVEAANASAERGLPVYGVGVLAEACTYRYPLSEEDGKSILFVYHFYGANVLPMPRPEAPGGAEALRSLRERFAAEGRSFLLIDHSIQPMEVIRETLMASFRPRLLWSGNGVRLELWSPRA